MGRYRVKGNVVFALWVALSLHAIDVTLKINSFKGDCKRFEVEHIEEILSVWTLINLYDIDTPVHLDGAELTETRTPGALHFNQVA